LFVSVGITFLIVRFGLMVFTNFTISNISYMYDDLAASIQASPKAYLVLLTVAFVASRMNLLYGWDFSGILIPSLLALQWYQPHKLVMSFAEAFLILLIARGLMQTPLLRSANIEGARKLLLFFNIGYAYKIVLGYLIMHALPETKITDAYGFGYLLSTLIALKMHDKDIAARLTRATLQTSLAGVAIASLVGFALTLLPLDALWQKPPKAALAGVVRRQSERSLAEQIREDKVLLYQAHKKGQVPLPLTRELDSFSRALTLLKGYVATADEGERAAATAYLGDIGYELLELEDRYLYLRESGPIRGWGIFVLNQRPDSRLLVELPEPLNERGTLKASTALFSELGGRGLAIAGSKRNINPDGSTDVLLNRQTLFHVFHRSLAGRNVLQVRNHTAEIARVLSGLRRPPGEVDTAEPASTLWIKAELPPGLDLVALKDMVGDLQIEWKSLPLANRQREVTRSGFAELVLNPASVRRIGMGARAIPVEHRLALQVSDQRIDGFLQKWLLNSKGIIAPRGSDAYVPPRIHELLYFDEEVLEPLLTTARTEFKDGQWSDKGREDILAIQSAVSVFGYQLTAYRHSRSGTNFLILSEKADVAPRRYWGTYVFRLGPARGYLVQVPRPLFEINSLEYGISLFEQLQAGTLLVAGADPRANLEGNADLLRLEHFRSLFSLVNQVVLRESGNAPMLVIQSRARGYRADVPQTQADALVSVAGAVGKESLSSPLVVRLVQALQTDGLSFEFVDGRPETAGYEIGDLPQSLYLAATRNKAFCALWLSLPRVGFRQQDDDRQEGLRFGVLGIQTVERDLANYIVEKGDVGESGRLPSQLRETIASYLNNADVVTLRRLQLQWPSYRWERVIDRNSRQSFLTVFDDGSRLRLVANLNPRKKDAVVAVRVEQPEIAPVNRFIESRSAWLEFRKQG
jgi:hypothetical protein